MEDNWPLLMMSRGPFDAHLVTGVTNGKVKDARVVSAFVHAEEDLDAVSIFALRQRAI